MKTAAPVLLDPAEEARAVALHRASTVVDSLGQSNPSVHPRDAERLIEELLDRGATLTEIGAEVGKATRAALLRGDLPEYWEGWERSGVSVASVTMGGLGLRTGAFEAAVRDVAQHQQLFDGAPRLVKVLSAADARRAKGHGNVGLILNLQDTSHFGADLERMDLLHQLGVRVVQLTYNSRNLVGDGCTERNPAGLSRFGVELVGRLNNLGILIDVSHCSEPTLLDAVATSQAPIAITHSFSSVIHPHDRGKSDDALRAVAAAGGYVGVCAVPFFLTGDHRPTLGHWAQHVLHACDLVGPEHVGIGSDWGGVIPPRLATAVEREMAGVGFRPEHGVDLRAVVEGFERFDRWPNFTRTLVKHGFSDDEIRGILGANFLRVFERAVGA